MLLIILIFLFIIYCILEAFKYNKLEFEETTTKRKGKSRYKEIKTLNSKIVVLKTIIYTLFFILLILNHFLDPLSGSTGFKGLISILVISGVFLGLCIRDVFRIRRAKNEKK